MPVSGNEEAGFKPIAWKSSDYSAGIPIKKRRFPLIRPPSPPSVDPPSLSAENDSQQKEHSSPSQGSAISNASVVAASFSAISDPKTNVVPEEEKRSSDVANLNLAQSSGNHPSIKIEEPSLAIHVVPLRYIDNKLVEGKNNANIPINSAKTELKLEPAEGLALRVGKGMCSEKKVEGRGQSEICTASCGTKLSLGFKEHRIQAVARQNSAESFQNHKNEEPVSLNLSLSKGDCSIEEKSDEFQSSSNGANMITNRSNWDLNTTMDAWEGAVNDCGVGLVTGNVLNRKGNSENMELSNCEDGMVGNAVISGKQNAGMVGQQPDIVMSSIPSSQQRKARDSLRLGLSPCLQLSLCEKPCSSSAKVDQGRIGTNVSLPGLVVTSCNVNLVNLRTVKSEPLDESMRKDSKEAEVNPVGMLDTAMKPELTESNNQETLVSPNVNPLRLVDPSYLKPESVNKLDQEALKKIERMSNQSNKQLLHASDSQGISSCSMSNQLDKVILQTEDSGRVPTYPEVVSGSKDVENQLEHSACGVQALYEVPLEVCESAKQVASEIIVSTGHDNDEGNVSGVIDTSMSEDKTVDDPEKCRLKLMDELAPDSCGTVEGSVSDEEKINLSGDMLEEDSYGSEYESDGNHDLSDAMDIDQDGCEDDYEDGEVRELVAQTEVENPRLDKSRAEDTSDSKIVDCAALTSNGLPAAPNVDEKHTKVEDPVEVGTVDTKESLNTVHDEKSNGGADTCLQESTEVPTHEVDIKKPIKAITRKPVDVLGRKDAPKSPEADQSSDQGTNASQGTLTTASLGSDGHNKNIEVVEKNLLVSPKVETSSNADYASKDANSGGSRSRIINLSSATNTSSTGKTRPISGKLLQSRRGGERVPDIALDREKLHPRGRDEVYVDGSHNFSRERHHDQSSRNSRLNFVRGRGRVSSRMDTVCGEWDSERDFAAEMYNGRREFPAPGRKYESAVTQSDIEFNNYNNIGQDGAFVGTGRGGRKLLNNDASFFRHLNPRRPSPGVRDGPTARGLPIIRRGLRNISPGNIGEEGSALLGLRHNEKFMRGFPDDNTDPVFARQTQYEGLDGHFVRGSRNFTSVQRRGLPRIRSKSPIRPRARSPGPWTSRRRTPDGFAGHPELPHRRSPPVYRMERMRSPDHPCFPGDMVVRRHGSPTYMSRPSNDLRDMDSGRDHGHPRSVIPTRSPSGRLLLRSNRRFDVVDPRERTDSDDYFGDPMNSGRFHELGGDGNVEERRRFGDRREPVRPFRPPYNGADAENFHLNAEDGPRPFRFCQDGEPEFHETGNLREFDRRIKNRPGDASRRTRSMEDQEGNFRHGGQAWHDDGFDDMSRVKRKRF